MNANLTNENLVNKLQQEYDLLKTTIQKPNIMLLGATGVGKSTLVNKIFGFNLAKAGAGRPVTQSINMYTDPSIGVVLYDSPGYEIGSEEQSRFLTEVVDYAASRQVESQNPENHIHIVWYCIQSTARVLDIDIQTIKEFVSLGIPIAVALTKGDLIDALEKTQFLTVFQQELPTVPVFLTTSDSNPDGLMDTVRLSDWSMEQLPAGLRTAYLSAQKLNLDKKKAEAAAVITQHTAGAFAVGFIPIPVSDAPILIANQMGLIARILYIYDMEYMLKSIQGMVSSMGVTNLVSGLGKWTVGQLLKLIPGFGTVVGGLISGSVASAITVGIGQSMSITCYTINVHTINNEKEKLEVFMNNLDENFQRLFKENLEV